MLDLAFVRANLPAVEAALRARNADPAALLGDFAAIDRGRRDAITELEQMKAKQNRISADIAKKKRSGQDAVDDIQLSTLLKKDMEWAEQSAADADFQIRHILEALPNLPKADVPIGVNEHGNVLVKTWGTPPSFDFKPKSHWELGESLNILDFDRAAKISGARFVVHYGAGARLERALANFMLDLHQREHGYIEVLPPSLVNTESVFSTGQLPKFEEDLFKIPTDRFEQDLHHLPVIGEQVFALGQNGIFTVTKVDGRNVTIKLVSADYSLTVPQGVLSYRRNYWLIPTAEVPVTNLFRDETLDETALPISLCAYTPCFRSEAGSYGRDVRGMIRQHQFQKVELVKFTTPDKSAAEHERLTEDAEDVLQQLGLPYRRMLLCTGDMGFAAAKTYDLEVWLPGQGLYREISSCSNFESFQARRANIRYRSAGAKRSEFLHTLNGSGLAIGRTYLAILENYQQKDGTVRIPEVLVPYMGGLEYIGPQASITAGVRSRQATGSNR